MLKLLIKKQLAAMLALFKICNIKTNITARNSFVLLMYHRVFLPAQKDAFIEPGMFVTPDTFELHLRFLSKYFNVVKLDDLFEHQSIQSSKPVCGLTFDDAWYDFYAHAFPLLKEYKIPATLFVPTHFIGKDKWFWTDRLAQILYQINLEKKSLKKEISTTIPINEILKCNGSVDMMIQNAINLLKAERETVIENTMDALIESFDIIPKTEGAAFLDWHQLSELAASEYITIGSHTDRHLILTNCHDEEILAELHTSKQKLYQYNLVNPDFIPFCYPNGNFNPKISKMAADTGYDMAVTTQNGWNQFTAERFALKRVGLHEDISSTSAMLSCRMAGIF